MRVLNRLDTRKAVLLSALQFAGMAIHTHHRTRLVERRNPPKGKFVDIGLGRRLHYVEAGQGRPVI